MEEQEPKEESSSTGSHLALGVAALGQLRWVATDVAAALEEGRRRLDLSPMAAVALGQSLAGAAMLLRFATKVPSRLTVELLGDGDLGKVMAQAKSDGSLRGLVGNPLLPSPEGGGLDLGPALGQGILRVTREQGEHRHTSQVVLGKGAVALDLAHYLEQSEQIHSAVLLGVMPRPEGIVAAGGLMVEALPGTEEEVLQRLETNISGLSGAVSQYLEVGGVDTLLNQVLEGLGREDLERFDLGYRCPCDPDSLRLQLASIAAKDLDSVVGDDGMCAAVCAFCGARYLFSREELAALSKEGSAGPN